MLNGTGLRLCGMVLAAGAAATPTLAGTYTTLYQFTGGSDGATPSSSPAYDEKGDLYGITAQGGNICPVYPGYQLGCGTVYKLSPSGQETTLVTFTGALNGANPDGPLTLVDHKIYGAAGAGGAHNDGVLFSVHTNGTHFRLLHTFHGSDGGGPIGPLLLGPAGALYGITVDGGPGRHGAGVLFELMPDGTYIRLHNFTGGTDGGNPNALNIDASGTLYGSTASGAVCPGERYCGVVFSYVPSTSTYTVLHQFTATDGKQPMLGSIGPDGILYGAAVAGGANNLGTLFELVPAGGTYSLTTLYSFGVHSPSGFEPSGGPVLTPYGALIGTTTNLPALYRFKFNRMEALYEFPAASQPVPPILDKNGSIYGANAVGGITPCASSAGASIFGGCGYIYSFLQ